MQQNPIWKVVMVLLSYRILQKKRHLGKRWFIEENKAENRENFYQLTLHFDPHEARLGKSEKTFSKGLRIRRTDKGGIDIKYSSIEDGEEGWKSLKHDASYRMYCRMLSSQGHSPVLSQMLEFAGYRAGLIEDLNFNWEFSGNETGRTRVVSKAETA